VACAASIGVLTFLQSCSSTKYVTAYKVISNKLSVKRSEFTVIKKGKTIQQSFILLKPENSPFPIALYKLPNDQYKALYLECSHQGCELNAYETTLVCPCHGAEFNTKGEVTQGPAELPLKTFITSSDADNIYIQIA
jgi:Rieske Fe-S protein